MLRSIAILVLAVIVEAGIQSFDLILEPTDEFVHYNDGYIRAPGFIDLGGLTFTALSARFTDDEFGPADSKDDTGSGTEGDDIPDGDGDGNRRLDGGVETSGTAVDIAIFKLPQKCAHKKKGCDWPSLGIGKRLADDTLRWCCNHEAILAGLCDDKHKGRLMLDEKVYAGKHRFITVPPEGNMSKQIKYGKVEQQESGTYVVLYANCDEAGREVLVSGQSIWKSSHGYLPGELYRFMFFFILATLVYFGILIWYGVSMYVNEENRIEIEKWIFLAIIMGLLEMIFRSGDYFVWNADGVRSNILVWVSTIVGVMKQGVSRCVFVMVSLGWGVVRDSLGSTMKTIVVLGTVFIVSMAARDLMLIFAIEDFNTLTYSEEEELVDAVTALTLVVSLVDVVFIMWILDALNNTMMYLENMNQSRKLERYLKLRCLFMVAVLLAVVVAVFSIVDSVQEEGIVGEEHAWASDAMGEVVYLFLLIGVAFLWKPNPNAKEFAYVMELRGTETELELGDVVPSAADDFDDAEMVVNKYDNDEDDNFRIT